MEQQYSLQIRDRITLWKTSSFHYSVEDAVEAAALQISFNPNLVMRIVDTLSDKVVWTSDKLPDFLDVKIADSGISGIGV